MPDKSRHLLDFSGTALASFLATAADGAVFSLLIFVASAAWLGGYWTGVAAALAAIVGGIIHFSLCRFWVFKRFEAPLQSSIPRYVLMSGAAALLHGAATQVLTDVGLVAGIAWFLSKALIYVAWTYPVSRYLVFEIDGENSHQPG